MTPSEKRYLGQIGFQILAPALMRCDDYSGVQALCVLRAIYRARHCWPWQRKERLKSVRDCHRMWREGRAMERELAYLRADDLR